jgi:hypothetical protein
MATYTAITDAEIDQDSPITQTLMTKYRDNLTAVIEGDASAPQIQTEAIADDAVTTAKLAVATRSFSGTVNNQTSTSISFTDNFAFAVRVTDLGDGLQVIIRVNSYLLNNPTEDNKTYALNWRYFNA